MKKKILLVLLFFGHLLLIFFQASWATFDAYRNYHYNETLYIPGLSLLKQNQYTDFYYLFTGINTGYGFYGIHTSSEKYLRVTYLDSADKVLKTDRYFNLSTSNGISRLEGYASFFANYIADTNKLIEADTTSSADNRPEVIQLRKDYQFRKEYVEKVLKWYGKEDAKNIPDCVSYKIELLTIVPEDTWKREHDTKPNTYVLQRGLFPVQ